MRMTTRQFDALCNLLRLRRTAKTREALRLILVERRGVVEAASLTGMSQPAVSNALKRARRVLGQVEELCLAFSKGGLSTTPD